jgi:ABC-type lipoprotein export system ATPase subunit
MSAAPPVLEAWDLAKSYRRGPEEIHALVGAELRIDAGEVIALVGPSGSGKTTLLAVLAGWESPDRGRMAWRGRPMERPADLGWAEVAIVPQTLGLMDELTVRENIGFPLRLDGTSGQEVIERVGALLTRFGLTPLADRLPSEGSLGEQQRAALARSLVRAPRLLMADEPTGHQDVGWAATVLQALSDAASNGTACLVATHHKAVASYADRVLAISDGELWQVDAASVIAEGEEL